MANNPSAQEPAAPEILDIENRRVERVACRIQVLLRIAGNYLCMAEVTDISADGMRLRIAFAGVLPGEFEVDGVLAERPVRVRRVWRRGQDVGVRLIKTAIAT